MLISAYLSEVIHLVNENNDDFLLCSEWKIRNILLYNNNMI